MYDVDGTSVRLSSPEKPYFAELGVTKAGVAEYVLAVGPGILAALKDRPTTLERWPQGVAEGMTISTRITSCSDAFYQKKAPATLPPWVQTAEVRFPSGRTATQIAPSNLATILWLVNLGTLRFHPWPVRARDTDAVDVLRLDLDPQPGTDFADAVVVAKELRRVLADAGLAAWVKTSGGRGLHVHAPIEPTDFNTARHAAIALGRELARRMPDRVTVDWWKELRGSRIFLDYNQTARDRLMTSAYSIRPTPAGLVSAPLAWEELDDVHPEDFSLLTMPARFADRGDAWAGLETARPRSLATALAWWQRDVEAGEGEMPYPPDYPKMPGEPPRVQPSRRAQAASS